MPGIPSYNQATQIVKAAQNFIVANVPNNQKGEFKSMEAADRVITKIAFEIVKNATISNYKEEGTLENKDLDDLLGRFTNLRPSDFEDEGILAKIGHFFNSIIKGVKNWLGRTSSSELFHLAAQYKVDVINKYTPELTKLEGEKNVDGSIAKFEDELEQKNDKRKIMINKAFELPNIEFALCILENIIKSMKEHNELVQESTLEEKVEKKVGASGIPKHSLFKQFEKNPIQPQSNTPLSNEIFKNFNTLLYDLKDEIRILLNTKLPDYVEAGSDPEDLEIAKLINYADQDKENAEKDNQKAIEEEKDKCEREIAFIRNPVAFLNANEASKKAELESTYNEEEDQFKSDLEEAIENINSKLEEEKAAVANDAADREQQIKALDEAAKLERDNLYNQEMNRAAQAKIKYEAAVKTVTDHSNQKKQDIANAGLKTEKQIASKVAERETQTNQAIAQLKKDHETVLNKIRLNFDNLIEGVKNNYNEERIALLQNDAQLMKEFSDWELSKNQAIEDAVAEARVKLNNERKVLRGDKGQIKLANQETIATYEEVSARREKAALEKLRV